MKLYPLQFEPILKERLWGGQKLKTILNKPIISDITGESWEISTVSNDVSIIAHGDYAGKKLTELINDNPDALLGTAVHAHFGNQFPLLFKYLDSQKDLSVQVHPNDELAQKRHKSFGKTEMWYVMQADENAEVIVGFKEKSSSKEYLKTLEDDTLVGILDAVKVKKGDVFFLETGTVHAIGAGILIAEIQQTSDITYRLYDFNRTDDQGVKRELHIDLALDAINYDTVQTYKEYDKEVNRSNAVVDCPYFTTNFIPLDGKMEVNKDGGSFTAYMCVDGSFELESEEQLYNYIKGDTVLMPAALKVFYLKGKASLLEIYIS